MKKARVLIVEDSFIVAFHLQKVLEVENYAVVGIQSTGESALMLLEKERPDIILMDIMLEGTLDGIETARIIRNNHWIPVIFLTALSDKATIQRAKVSEPYGYLTKPFQEREIFTTIEMALYKHKIESELRASELKYFSTVRSISDAVILLDEKYHVTYLNPKAQQLSGWGADDIVNKNLFDFIVMKDAGGDMVNPLHCSLNEGKTNSFSNETILISKEGVEYPVGEGSLSPMIDTSGNCIGMVMIFKDLSEKKAHQKLIREFEIKRLAALIEGQEAERSRVAKDLHDGLGQVLTAIKINLNLANGFDSAKLNTLVEEAIQESVRISENLLPAKLKDFGLATCLKSLCTQLNEVSDVTINFESLTTEPDLNQVKKTNLYRIAQEAISNAIKHANAQTITVQLNEIDGFMQLTIEDDGRGFITTNPVDNSQHHGLANMRERTEILGGKLTIESDEARGTLIVVETPI